jgi:hypothetical protein
MKENSKWIATAIAVAGGLAAVSSAQAQGVTGDATLDNVPPGSVTAYYASWSTQPPTTVTDGPSGLTVMAGGYGSLYDSISSPQVMNASDNQVSLTFTINSPAGSYYVGVPFAINDNSGNVFYGGYSTYGPGTWTETAPLSAAQQTAISAGGDVIYSFNLEFDPAGNLPNGGGAGPYNITFNSLVLSEATPEPSTLALVGSGIAGLLAFRRRIL